MEWTRQPAMKINTIDAFTRIFKESATSTPYNIDSGSKWNCNAITTPAIESGHEKCLARFAKPKHRAQRYEIVCRLFRYKSLVPQTQPASAKKPWLCNANEPFRPAHTNTMTQKRREEQKKNNKTKEKNPSGWLCSVVLQVRFDSPGVLCYSIHIMWCAYCAMPCTAMFL